MIHTPKCKPKTQVFDYFPMANGDVTIVKNGIAEIVQKATFEKDYEIVPQ